MLKLNRLVFFLLLAGGVLLLSACGPSYKTYTHYQPPPDERGKSCVFQCENQRLQCDNGCRQKYEDCLSRAKLEGRQEYLDARENYLSRKESCLNRSGNKECQGLISPRLDSYVQDSHCRQDCGCEEAFNRCFQICGGRIEHTTRCVSGCQ